MVRALLFLAVGLSVGIPAGAQPCVAGRSGEFPCNRVGGLSFVPLTALGAGGSRANDLWGWTHRPSGREFVLLGLGNGTAFVEVTNPTAPRFVGHLAAHGASSPWRDIKVYKDHAYVVSEAPDHGMQILGLQALVDASGPPAAFEETIHFVGEGLSYAHNIAINEESGFAYVVGSNLCNGGLVMLNIDRPRRPQAAGCFSSDGYTHDVQCVSYRGPDPDYSGREVCFAFNEDTVTIVDVSDKAHPRQVSRTSYPGVGYTHQGWLTEDHLFLLMGDELDEENFGHRTLTRIWDVSNLDRPVLIGEHRAATHAIDHNMYVRDGLAYQANYRAGLRIFDLAEVASGRLVPFGFFDIFPADDASEFDGAWSVYPFFPSGVVALGSIERGLFILDPRFGPPSP